MSFVKLHRGLFEHVSIKTRPKVSFVTSSLGATGTMYLSAKPSPANRQLSDPTVFTDSHYNNRKNIVNKFLILIYVLSIEIPMVNLTLL